MIGQYDLEVKLKMLFEEKWGDIPPLNNAYSRMAEPTIRIDVSPDGVQLIIKATSGTATPSIGINEYQHRYNIHIDLTAKDAPQVDLAVQRIKSILSSYTPAGYTACWFHGISFDPLEMEPTGSKVSVHLIATASEVIKP